MRLLRDGLFAVLCATVAFGTAAYAQVSAGETEIVKPKNYTPLKVEQSSELQATLDSIVSDFIKSYTTKPLKPEELSVTLIDLTKEQARGANFRGNVPIYPASVVKMFYMAALYQQLEDGKLMMTPELERGLRDMIIDSSNEATQYIVDVLTQTSSGAELPEKEFELWSRRRNRMNRYFASMGYTNINVNQKTHCEDAYGVEQQFRNYKGENRNMLTTDASARLIAEIARGQSVNPARSKMMMDLLARDPFEEKGKANSQATDFAGKALIDGDIKNARLWSKAGWTSRSRHDAAYIETPSGSKFAVAIFTEHHSNEKEIIASIVSKLIERLDKERK
jgi:beta-lactamase class A